MWQPRISSIRRLLLLLSFGCILVSAQQDVKFVNTAADLQEAVTQGTRHIIIQQNLDLRTLTPVPGTSAVSALLVIGSKTKSIRGDCAGAPQLEGIRVDPPPSSVGQCVLLLNQPLLELNAITSELLLSDVYLRIERTPAQQEVLMPIMSVTKGSTWITTTVFRGDKVDSRAVDLGRGQHMHARKTSFIGFKALDSAAVRVAAGARAGFKDCTFNINTAVNHGSSVGMSSGAVRDVPAATWFQSCTFSSNFDPLAYPVSQTDERSLHYNNRAFQKSVDASTNALLVPEPIEPEGLNQLGFLVANSDSYRSISAEQARITNLKPIVIDSLAEATSDDAGSPSSGPDAGAIAGGVVGAVGLCAVAVALFVVLRRRQRRKAARSQHQMAGPVSGDANEKPVQGISYSLPPLSRDSGARAHSSAASHYSGIGADPFGIVQSPSHHASLQRNTSHPHSGHGPTPVAAAHMVTPMGSVAGSVSRGSAIVPPPALHANGESTLSSHSSGTSGRGLPRGSGAPTSGGPPMLPPGVGGGSRPVSGEVAAALAFRSINSAENKSPGNGLVVPVAGVRSGTAGKMMDRDSLEEALDHIYDRRILFLGRLELYSQVHRRVGGQGVVQSARGRYDEEEYVIKFFLNRTTFEREEALYLRDDLRRMMPAVKDIVPNVDGAICDAAGRLFPPAIVIEKGEPLNEWAMRIEPDFPTILTVLCHVLARLQQLHSVGIAHRDIKPGNVLWRPKHHSWTLIDFGCAAEIGQTCPLSLSLLYAAPESVHALEAGQRTTVADPATDMWALGVISFELLTASRTFPRSMNAEDIRAAIAGRAPLPWETPDFRKKAVPELRMLRRSVLSCLNRDAMRRPSSSELLQSWNGLFDQATKGTLTEEMEPQIEPLDSMHSSDKDPSQMPKM